MEGNYSTKKSFSELFHQPIQSGKWLLVHHHHRHHRRRRQQQQGGKKLFTCKTTAKSTSAGRGATRDKFLSTSKLLSITVWQMECILKLFAHGGHHNSVKSPAPSILCLRLSSCGPSSNPKHAIYAFLIIKLKLLFDFELKKWRNNWKQTIYWAKVGQFLF